jgi:acetyl esterase/lipase
MMEEMMTEAQNDVPFIIPPAPTSHIRHKMLDVPYATLSPAQKLDIYWPEASAAVSANAGPFPVIISIHGGAFMGGDKGDVQVKPMLEGLNRGYVVVSINYRMSGEAKFPALVQDAKAAVRWVRANAEKMQLDSNKIAAWGGSAGGWQASMLGVSGGVGALEDLSLGNPDQPSHVQAVVDWFGPTDFLKMDADLAEYKLGPTPGDEHSGERSPESLILGAKITQIPELVKAANPETYVRPGLPPFLLQHGTQDATVPCLQSVRFAEKLRAVLGPENVTLELLEGARHADPMFETPENLERVFAFLDSHIKETGAGSEPG